jgi:hypothetical protein
MTAWLKPIGKIPRVKPFPLPASGQQISVAFPYCSIRGGLCDALLSALPLAIIGIQFIRDESAAVQDALVIFANARASSAFASRDVDLSGALFLKSCGDALPDGGWQSCIWVASSGKPETILQFPGDAASPPRFLTIAPYGDGLILSQSLA